MAGIYIHIPFCKKKCHYCDFYSNTRINLSEPFVDALIKELVSRKNYLKGESISSIYFGGGTPSMLEIRFIEAILKCIRDNFHLDSQAEISFECNPDDIDLTYLMELKSLGINRLSIGIQSLNNDILKFLNRRHSSEEALKAVDLAKIAGFEEISIDLIFGIPGLEIKRYEETLNKIILLDITHISAYQLTIEPNTVLYKFLEKDKFRLVEEEDVLAQFDMTIKMLKQHNFQHYEISNYSRPGHESHHNLLYWNNGIYLGIGPSAHSYDGYSRQWNISNTSSYIKCISENRTFFEREDLTEKDRYNEYILTGLRTSKGISKKYIKKHFGTSIVQHFYQSMEKLDNQWYNSVLESDSLILTKKGIFILDFIIKLFYYI
jgi:oxygen-independent coproporphyrinogen-3 oxidase